MMSCFVGLVEYARATGDGDILQMVLDARDRIADSMRYPTGGMSSNEWFTFPGELPERANIETCVAFTWVQLNLRLFEVCGDERGVELAEWTAWNQLFPALAPDCSTWTYHLPVTGPKRFARRGGQEGDEGGALTCCHTNGQRGLALLPQYQYTLDGAGALCVNLYGASSAVIELPGAGPVRVEQHTAFPRANEVELRLHPDGPASYTVRLRQPEWADGLEVQGAPVAPNGHRHDLTCRGEVTLRVRFRMRPRLLLLGFEARGRCTASYGPLVMALDKPPAGWALDAVALAVHPEAFPASAALAEEQGWPALDVPAIRLPGLVMADASAMAQAPRAAIRLKPVLLCGLEGNPCLESDLGFGDISVHNPDSRALLPEYRVMLPGYPPA